MNRILLVDDEPDILRVLCISLRADGYAVLTASSGEEGFGLIRTRNTRNRHHGYQDAGHERDRGLEGSKTYQ